MTDLRGSSDMGPPSWYLVSLTSWPVCMLVTQMSPLQAKEMRSGLVGQIVGFRRAFSRPVLISIGEGTANENLNINWILWQHMTQSERAFKTVLKNVKDCLRHFVAPIFNEVSTV